MEHLGDDLMIQNPLVSQNNFTFVAKSIFNVTMVTQI